MGTLKTHYFPVLIRAPQGVASEDDDKSPPPLPSFHPVPLSDRQQLSRFERQAALVRVVSLLRFMGLSVLAISALALGLVWANSITVRVTLSITTMPPCLDHGETELKNASVYFQEPMRAYVPFNVCSSGDVDILIVVQSRNGHRNLRERIRSSWGNLDYLKKTSQRVEVLYVLEYVVQRMPKDVAFEMIDHQDMLLPSPTKTFSFIVGRSIATYQWIANFCPHAKYVVHTVDSVDMNLPALFNFTRQMASVKRTMFGSFTSSLAGRSQLQAQLNNGSRVAAEDLAVLGKYKYFSDKSTYVFTGDSIHPMCIAATKTALAGMKLVDENITVTGLWPIMAGLHLLSVFP